MEEIILIDKPAGLSSFGVVARVRRKLRDREGKKVKVGHTGTLDPFATGLLILLAGTATKRSDEFLKKIRNMKPQSTSVKLVLPATLKVKSEKLLKKFPT